MPVQAIELIQAVADDELDDGLQLVGAGFEDQEGKQVGATVQDKVADQLVDEGLRGFHPREIQKYFVIAGEQTLQFLAQLTSGKARTKETLVGGFLF